MDKYKCHCKKGFYHPNRVAVNGFTSKSVTNKSHALVIRNKNIIVTGFFGME